SNPVRIQSPSPDLLGPARVQQRPSRFGPLGPIQWFSAQFDRGPSELPRPSLAQSILPDLSPSRPGPTCPAIFDFFSFFLFTESPLNFPN
ncbi:hypothetical protein CRG98_046713, partial [Punica granatum]